MTQPGVEPSAADRYLNTMPLFRSALCLALLAGPASAWAQQVIVIPRDAQVVVPPRGAQPARTPPPAPPRVLPQAAGAPTVLAPGAVGLAPVAGIALPLIATAILAGSLGSPSRTR